jgi:hypothetical protein
MAEVLVAYVTDAERREREGSAARARAEKEFSMEAMVRGYMEVYSRVLRTHEGSSVEPRSARRARRIQTWGGFFSRKEREARHGEDKGIVPSISGLSPPPHWGGLGRGWFQMPRWPPTPTLPRKRGRGLKVVLEFLPDGGPE